MSPGSLSSFPEDLIIMSARIVLSSEIDIAGRRLRQRGKDRLVRASEGNTPGNGCVAIWIPVGRRDCPEQPSAEMAHVKATIAGRAEGCALIVRPMLLRQTIGREAFPPVIAVAIAPGVKTTVDTGATELFLCANCKSFQGDLIGA